MAFQIVKGQKVDLTKNHPDLKKISVFFDWKSYANVEVDPSAFLLNTTGKVNREEDFIFYNNPDGAFILLQDSVFSDFRKQLNIDLGQVSPAIDRIAITLTLYEAEQKKITFGMVNQCVITLMNQESGIVICEYNLGSDFSTETALVACEIYRYKGEWKFNAVGSGFFGGLAALCRHYGVETID